MRRLGLQFCRPLRLIECPRDAMQGLSTFIPTGDKIRYINSLLKCGFDTIDFGSFVSAPAVPQMRDTADVLKGLDLSNTDSKLLVIVANARGAEAAAKFDEIQYLGFPLSISETFQQRNTNKSIEDAFATLKKIKDVCDRSNKTLVTYLSMGFGNPYGEEYSEDTLDEFTDKLDRELSVPIISLADTIGVSDPDLIGRVFNRLIPRYPHIEFGAHFHSSPASAPQKVEAAYNAGVRRLDTALGGMGGCPFAKAALVGNIPTEVLLDVLERQGVQTGIDSVALGHSVDIRSLLFGVGVRELVLATVLGDDTEFRRVTRNHFDAANVTQDGLIDLEQFQTVLNSVYAALGEGHPEEELVQRAMTKFDTDGDGRLNFEEYVECAKYGLQKRLEAMQ